MICFVENGHQTSRRSMTTTVDSSSSRNSTSSGQSVTSSGDRRTNGDIHSNGDSVNVSHIQIISFTAVTQIASRQWKELMYYVVNT